MGIFVFGSGGGGDGGGGGSIIDLLANDTMQPQFALSGKTFHDKEGIPRTGTIPTWNGNLYFRESTDANKRTVTPNYERNRIIYGGQYLGRDIEITSVPGGSATMAQSGNKVTLTKQAGYIESGTQQLTLGAGDATLTRSGATVTLTKKAGYISDGTSSVTVPLQAGSVNITANGTQTFYPSSGNAGLSSLIVNTSVPGSTPSLQNRSVTITSNGTNTYYATSSAYDGLYSLTVTTNVNSAPSTGSGTVSNGGSYLDISCPSGYTLYMAGFMASSASYSNTSRAVGGYARKGSSTGRGSYITSGGDPAVGNLTASFSGNTVTITPLSGYSFSGMSYVAFVVYG